MIFSYIFVIYSKIYYNCKCCCHVTWINHQYYQTVLFSEAIALHVPLKNTSHWSVAFAINANRISARLDVFPRWRITRTCMWPVTMASIITCQASRTLKASGQCLVKDSCLWMHLRYIDFQKHSISELYILVRDNTKGVCSWHLL